MRWKLLNTDHDWFSDFNCQMICKNHISREYVIFYIPIKGFKLLGLELP